MVNENTLDHLLHIESEAAALINDAQNEADRQIRECENKNHALYEKTFQQEISKQESLLQKEKTEIKNKYDTLLAEYKDKISNVKTDFNKFSALFNEFLGNMQ